MKLKSLEVAEVKEFLKRNLHWRILDVSIPLEIPGYKFWRRERAFWTVVEWKKKLRKITN
jgi:hypothetical protein